MPAMSDDSPACPATRGREVPCSNRCTSRVVPMRRIHPQSGAVRGDCRCRHLASIPTGIKHSSSIQPAMKGTGWVMSAPDREKALDIALAQIEKQYGKGSIMRLGDEGRAPIEVIPTGSIALDVALGIGGLPRGRVVEIYGPESSGKTTVDPARGGQRAGRRAASRPSSTPSTRWTRSTPRRSASTPTRCWSPSRTPVSRRWRSPTC